MRISDWSSDVCSSDLSAGHDLDELGHDLADAGQRHGADDDARGGRRQGDADHVARAADEALDHVVPPAPRRARQIDRKGVVSGKSVTVRVDPGCTRTIKKKNQILTDNTTNPTN